MFIDLQFWTWYQHKGQTKKKKNKNRKGTDRGWETGPGIFINLVYDTNGILNL